MSHAVWRSIPHAVQTTQGIRRAVSATDVTPFGSSVGAREQRDLQSTQLPTPLVSELGENWGRRREPGELLRSLLFEGTRPTGEEVAAQLGCAPLDVGPP